MPTALAGAFAMVAASWQARKRLAQAVGNPGRHPVSQRSFRFSPGDLNAAYPHQNRRNSRKHSWTLTKHSRYSFPDGSLSFSAWQILTNKSSASIGRTYRTASERSRNVNIDQSPAGIPASAPTAYRQTARRKPKPPRYNRKIHHDKSKPQTSRQGQQTACVRRRQAGLAVSSLPACGVCTMPGRDFGYTHAASVQIPACGRRRLASACGKRLTWTQAACRCQLAR